MASPTPSNWGNPLNIVAKGMHIAFGSFGDQLLAALPKAVMPGIGPTLTTNTTPDGNDLTGFSAWYNLDAVETPSNPGTPTADSTVWTLCRLASLSLIDWSFEQGSHIPNSPLQEEVRLRFTSMLRQMAGALSVGSGVVANNDGFLGLLDANFPKVTPTYTQTQDADGILTAMRLLYHAVLAGELGENATVFVTTQKMVRNIVWALEQVGIEPRFVRVEGVKSLVPSYMGIPILYTSGLSDSSVPAESPVFALCFEGVHLLSTVGTPESFGIAQKKVPVGNTGAFGTLLSFEGALITPRDSYVAYLDNVWNGGTQ